MFGVQIEPLQGSNVGEARTGHNELKGFPVIK